jgi:hypothetical protein
VAVEPWAGVMRRPSTGVARRTGFRGIGGGAPADPLAVLYTLDHSLLLRSDAHVTKTTVSEVDYVTQWTGTTKGLASPPAGGVHNAGPLAESGRPLFVASYAPFGGRPAVKTVEGDTRRLSIADHASLRLSATGFTVYAVYARGNDTATQVDFFVKGGRTEYSLSSLGNRARWQVRNAANNDNFGTTDTVTALAVDTAVVVRGQHVADTTVGVRVGAGTDVTAAAATYRAATATLELGGLSGVFGTHLMGVFFVVQRIPDATEDAKIMSALNKWRGA